METQLNFENYFKNLLSEGKDIKICFMSHNSYWPVVMILNREFPNCKVNKFGGSVSYLPRHSDDSKEDFDLILLYSSRFYSESEISTMRNLAHKVSKLYSKRTTVGYYYILENSKDEEIRVYSTKDNEEFNDIIKIKNPRLTVIDFLNLITSTHNNLNKESFEHIRKKE